MPEASPDPRATSPYAGATLALLTRHGKESVLGPMVRERLDARVLLVDDFDTDSLGTFTRDVPRTGSQLDAARTKARLGAERSGLTVGLGSEGSFVPGPFGFGSFDLELVVLVDLARGLEIVGRSYAPARNVQSRVQHPDELAEVAHLAGFPEHGLVVRPDDAHDPRIRKGLRAWPALEHAYRAARAESTTGAVFVESDLRAHMHPTRMANIASAARDLLVRVCCRCDLCGAPGFGVIGPVPGLPCRLCGEPTGDARADEVACTACDHREIRLRHPTALADPARCPECNP